MNLFSIFPFLGLITVIPAIAATPVISPVVEPRLGPPDPTVVINAPAATLIGSSGAVLGVIPGTVESFVGIPFAQPPVGQLRLKPPVRITNPLGTIKVQNSSANSCPQFLIGSNVSVAGIPPSIIQGALAASPFNAAGDGQEDCLTLDVQRPVGTKSDAKLPVIVWIFGGGFELGSTAQYSGSNLVSSGVALGKPFMFVAMNYRVGAWGFMPGKEILADGSANIGLLDQRMAMEWVADNVAQFGGDPDKVVIWGESAGAISVFDQLLLNNGSINYNGKPLFRGAIMDSGSVVPADPVDTAKGQVIYDSVVQSAGCTGQQDTLACLRGVNESTFFRAANSVPGVLSFTSVALSYLPRPDGKVLAVSPEEYLLAGSSRPFPDIPFILGDQEDEGTLFSLFQSNLSTTKDTQTYLKNVFFHGATDNQIAELVATYPDDPAAGSPFGTGTDNNIYPQFKRLAALLGDATFTLTRRASLKLINQMAPQTKTWSYLSTYSKLPFLGSFHATDLVQVFYGIPDNNARKNIHQYYFNFLYNLDPNDQSGGTTPTLSWQVPHWPMWKEGNMLLNISADNLTLIPDNFRQQSFEYLLNNSKAFHI